MRNKSAAKGDQAMGVHHTNAPSTPQQPAQTSEPPAPSRESAARGTHDTAFDLLRHLLPQGRVLDLPCGSGAFLKRLIQAGYEALGADIEPHPAVPDAAFELANMDEPLPFSDAAFDAVANLEGIEHIHRPWDFIRECARILRPDGLLVITTPNISALRSRWRWFLTGFHNKCKYPLDESHPAWRHHVNMMSYPQLRYMLHSSGFQIEQLATNRVKTVSWLYLPWWPVQWIAAKLIFPAGVRGQEHARIIEEVRRDMLKPAVVFGETLIIAARRR
jgi:SAM-dependent methyltransferase